MQWRNMEKMRFWLWNIRSTLKNVQLMYSIRLRVPDGSTPFAFLLKKTHTFLSFAVFNSWSWFAFWVALPLLLLCWHQLSTFWLLNMICFLFFYFLNHWYVPLPLLSHLCFWVSPHILTPETLSPPQTPAFPPLEAVSQPTFRHRQPTQTLTHRLLPKERPNHSLKSLTNLGKCLQSFGS